ncbi:hypothetical protein EV175_007132, partial [Coemansia sp. RSA 1933]
LAHNLSPRLVDRGAQLQVAVQRQQQQRMGGAFVSPQGPMFTMAQTVAVPSSSSGVSGMPTLTAAGRLTRNRTLLRQSSGLTSASFHNDLVPQPTESFFAPLDEVCSDSGGGGADQSFVSQGGLGVRQPSASVGLLSTATAAATAAAPPMGSQFSPAMPMTNSVSAPQQADWPNTTYYGGRQQQQQRQGAIFSQMPSLTGGASSLQSQSQSTESGLANGLKRTRINQDGSFIRDDDSAADYDSEDDDGSETGGT